MGSNQWNDVEDALGDTLCYKKLEDTTVDSCNDEDGVIEMKVTLRQHRGTYTGIDADGKGTFTADDLQSSFSEDGNFLIMTKTFGGDGCDKITVDGVEVCSQVDETITLQCKYPLADQTVTDTFDVTGQDTVASAENTGTLGYTLSVDANTAIGEVVKFTISPINSGLVYATVKSCDVTNSDASNNDRLTIIGHGAAHCLNPVVGARAITNLLTSNDDIEGSWVAFKWSTATTDPDAEGQGLSCTIALSENASVAPVGNCQTAN